MRVSKGAGTLLFFKSQKIKLPCDESGMLSKNFLHPKQPAEAPEEAGL